MKKSLSIMLVAMLVLVLFGCATPHVFRLKDGTMIESTDKPKFDKKTGFYEIKGKDGKTVKINKDEVVEIKEK